MEFIYARKWLYYKSSVEVASLFLPLESVKSLGKIAASRLALNEKILRLQFFCRDQRHAKNKDHFHKVSSKTPPTIMAALITILSVTRSTSRKKSALKIREKNGPVLLIGITTETLPKSRA